MPTARVLGLLVITIILWSSAFVGIRIGLTGFTPGPLALYRFLIGAAVMVVINHLTPMQPISWRARCELLALGMLGIGAYNLCLNQGELTVTAGIASFIIGLMPIITLVISIVFLKERPSGIIYLGIAVSLVGLTILALAEHQVSKISGMGWVLLSAISGSIYAVLLRHYILHHHPIVVSTWGMVGGMIFLLVFTPALWHEIGTAPIAAQLSAVYLGVFPAAIAYLAWGYLLNDLAASKATLCLYALPLLSTLLGYLVLGEVPTTTALLGASIALIGALLASLFRTR